MQLTLPFAIAIYLGSYLPLAVILLAQDLDLDIVKTGLCPVSNVIKLACTSPLKHTVLSVAAMAVCTCGMLITAVVLRVMSMRQHVTVVESKHIPADLMNYVLPYLVSFISLDYDGGAKLIGFGVFFIWVFFITYRSGQIALNPVLTVLGWKLFEVKYRFHGSKDIFVGRILSNYNIEPNQDYYHESLQDVMIVRRGKGASYDDVGRIKGI